VLAELESNGAIKIAGAMYNLQTGVMDFFGWFSAPPVHRPLSCPQRPPTPLKR